MRMSPRRAEAEIEGPFRTPEQLALAMPLVAMIGLMVVVSAVATGGSATVVALVALGGFGLCALAPMALIDVYVTRPLRGALAQMRAARDGQSGRGAFASGVVADLVHLARDIHVAQASLGSYGEVYVQCERMIAASDEAVRALRLHSEDIAEAAMGESRSASPSREIAELAEAVKALRGHPPAPGLDGAVERLESMLVYIAESLERIEAKDRHGAGGFGQIEQGIADLARLVSRETESIQSALSNGGLAMRADVAGVAADDKIGRMRVLERLDALETGLNAKLAEAPSPDAREIAQAIHAEAEANRRALREDAASGRLEAAAADLARAATEISQGLASRPTGEPPAALADDMRAVVATVAGLAETLAPGAIVEALRAELSAAAPSGGDLRAELSRLAERRLGADASTGSDLTSLRDDLQAVAAEISAKIEAVRAQLGETGRALPQLETPELAAAQGATDEAAARFNEAVAARLREQSEAQARRLDEIEGRVVDKILALGRDNEATTLTALMRAAKQIVEAANWLDSLGVRPAFEAGERPDIEAWRRLEGDVRSVAGALETLTSMANERLEALARQLQGATASDTEPLREMLGQTEARLTGALADVAARVNAIEAQALAPASAALSGAAQAFVDAQARVEAAAAKIEAGDPRLDALLDSLASRPDADALAPAREALAEAAQRFEAAQGRLAEVAAQIETGAAVPGEIHNQLAGFAQALGAHKDDLAELAPARASLVAAAQRFEAAQAQLMQAAAQIEAGDPRLAATLEALSQSLPGALDPALATLGEAARAFEAAQGRFEGEGVGALREDIAAMQARFERLGVERLPEVAHDLHQTQARWRELVGEFETGARKLAALAEADGRDIDALRADFAVAGENVCAAVAAFASRFDAESEAQIERLSQAVETQSRKVVAAPLAALAQAMGGIEAALADDSHMRATQQAVESLRGDFTAAAQAAAVQYEHAAQSLTRGVEDRIEMLRRGELSPAIAAAQATAQDLHTAHANLFSHIEALKAALLTDRSSFAALRLDVVEAFAKVTATSERADDALREAADRSQALALSVADLGAAERAELGVVSRALADTSERVASVARALEVKRGDLDLPALAADLTGEIDALARATATLAGDAGEALGAMRAMAQALDIAGIGGKLDGFAQTQDEGLRALVDRLVPPAASALAELRDLARHLQVSLALRGEAVVEAVAENSARLDALARLQDERLDGLEKALSAESPETDAKPRALTPGDKPTGAVAKLVVSMADALDFRFSHIETALADLSERLQAPEIRRDDDALDAGVAALATQLRSASDTLKSGLTDFVGVSAALAQEVARSPSAEASSATKAAAYKH